MIPNNIIKIIDLYVVATTTATTNIMLANDIIINIIYRRLKFLSFKNCLNVNTGILFSELYFFIHLLYCTFIKMPDIIKQPAKALAIIKLDLFITLSIKMVKKFITKNDIVNIARIMFMIRNVFPAGVL
jgi:hypothetical protein